MNLKEQLKSDPATLQRFAEVIQRTRSVRRGFEVLTEAGTTSDFPLLLSNEVGKVLLQAYRAVPDYWQRLTRQVDAPDFKEQKVIRLSEADDLLRVAELGEYRDSTLSETAEGYRVAKYGREFGVSWETIVNDDLSGITRQPERFGRAAARLVNELAFAILENGHDATKVAMADGKALFCEDHANLLDEALDEGGFEAALTALRRQTDDKGKEIIIVGSLYLVVPPEKEFAARKIIESAASTLAAGNSGIVNPARGRAEIISPESLKDTDDWYLVADPGSVDGIYMAFLRDVGRSPQLFLQEPGWRFVGGGVPDISQGVGLTGDCARYRVRHVVGAKAVDWRFAIKSIPGA